MSVICAQLMLFFGAMVFTACVPKKRPVPLQSMTEGVIQHLPPM
jgi:hypothetical protein